MEVIRGFQNPDFFEKSGLLFIGLNEVKPNITKVFGVGFRSSNATSLNGGNPRT
jgi:hypothetical protein